MVGLRTGFCGSLTTFASWELSLVTLLIGGRAIQGGQWAEFLWGLVIGFQLSLSSYMFGAHLAANLDYVHNTSAAKQRQRDNSSKAGGGKPSGSKGLADGETKPRVEGVGGRGVEYEGDSASQAGWDLEERGQVEDVARDSDGWREEEEGKVEASKSHAVAAKPRQSYRKVSQ